MKYAVVAALFAAVSADVCEPDKLSYEFFDDKECTVKNEDLTTKFGTLDEVRDYKHYEDTCQVADKWGYKFSCDGTGMHQSVWENTTCDGNTITKIDIKWTECS